MTHRRKSCLARSRHDSPKGLRNIAQGCGTATTLGDLAARAVTTPKRLPWREKRRVRLSARKVSSNTGLIPFSRSSSLQPFSAKGSLKIDGPTCRLMVVVETPISGIKWRGARGDLSNSDSFPVLTRLVDIRCG